MRRTRIKRDGAQEAVRQIVRGPWLPPRRGRRPAHLKRFPVDPASPMLATGAPASLRVNEASSGLSGSRPSVPEGHCAQPRRTSISSGSAMGSWPFAGSKCCRALGRCTHSRSRGVSARSSEAQRAGNLSRVVLCWAALSGGDSASTGAVKQKAHAERVATLVNPSLQLQ